MTFKWTIQALQQSRFDAFIVNLEVIVFIVVLNIYLLSWQYIPKIYSPICGTGKRLSPNFAFEIKSI